MTKHQRGWWGMYCFNGLSTEQQTFLVQEGYLEFGYRPEGDCLRGAEIEITTMHDEMPGPRFYCRPCAIRYLLESDMPERVIHATSSEHQAY